MVKRVLSMLLAVMIILCSIPLTAMAADSEYTYISISYDGQYAKDANDAPIAYAKVSLDDLANIDLTEYGLGDYLYDADSDGVYEITALHLYIYTHTQICGKDWSEVSVSGSAGSIFFESGLFGFTDCNLRYDYNGAYPADENGWGITADQIVISDGDFFAIAGYTSWNFYGDSATGFHYFADANGDITHEYTAVSGEALAVNLVRSYTAYDDQGNAVDTLAPEANYTVSYGTTMGTATNTVTTDDNGSANITFPSAGTWYVWCDGGEGADNAVGEIVSSPAYAKVTVEDPEPAEPIDVIVSIADKGEVVMALETVTVTDRDASGDFNVDEVLYAAHEAAYEGGAEAGYSSVDTEYGLSVATLWGDENGSYGYWLNDASCWSLDDTVVEGDSLVAFVYQNTEVWDSYSKFTSDEYDTTVGTALPVTLEKAGYDESWNTVFSAHAGAELKVYDSDFKEVGTSKYVISDNEDGTYSVTVNEYGEYIIVAYDNETPTVPALAMLNVEWTADAVEEKITAIGDVTIFSGNDIADAREAYDTLTDAQKEQVENVETLTVAEATWAEFCEEAAAADHEAIYEATEDYLLGLGTPDVGSVGGEWMIIALTRAGVDCPDGYYENVVEYVNANINENEQLHKAKSTDNSRVILALTAAGYDVTNVDGHNLLFGLTDMNYVKKQGINGPIWALIAFDCYDYEIPVNENAEDQVTREKLINYILEKQLADGGWALSGTVYDPDMTGMALQALAPYYDADENVKAAVDKALALLSEKQSEIGGFGSVDGACSESCAQIVVALTALGIDPETDSRFVKNGISVLDAMCVFAVEDGGFVHVPGGTLNGMATEQSQYALASYFRFVNDETSLYDMTDVSIDYVPVLKQHTDGNWYLFEGEEIMTDYTGFADNEYGTWYVENGKVTFAKNDVIKDEADGTWKYVVNSKFTEKDTVAKNSNGWWRIEDGIVNFSATGVYQNENGWWYCKDGQVQFGYTGIQKNENGWWRIVGGKVDFSATGVYQNELGWWYCKDGKVQFNYTGIKNNANGWWRIENGKVNFSANGVYQNENGWWKVENGKVNFGFTGIAQNSNGKWYCKDGKVDFSKNGRVYYSGKYYTVKGGKVV